MPAWNELFEEAENRWQEPLPAVLAFQSKFLKTGKTSTLDLGCGAGRNLIPIARTGSGAVGMDISGNGLKFSKDLLRKNGFPEILVQADMSAPLPFASACFDNLISIHVIFHNPMAKIRFTLSEIYRVLKPRGMALITFNTVYSSRFGSGVELEPGTWIPDQGVDKGIVHHFCTFDDLAKLMTQFKIYKVELDENIKDGSCSSHWLVTAQKPVGKEIQ